MTVTDRTPVPSLEAQRQATFDEFLAVLGTIPKFQPDRPDNRNRERNDNSDERRETFPDGTILSLNYTRKPKDSFSQEQDKILASVVGKIGDRQEQTTFTITPKGLTRLYIPLSIGIQTGETTVPLPGTTLDYRQENSTRFAPQTIAFFNKLSQPLVNWIHTMHEEKVYKPRPIPLTAS